MGGLHTLHLRRYDQGARRSAKAVLPSNEGSMGSAGETDTGTPGNPEIYMEGGDAEIYRAKEGFVRENIQNTEND